MCGSLLNPPAFCSPEHVAIAKQVLLSSHCIARAFVADASHSGQFLFLPFFLLRLHFEAFASVVVKTPECEDSFLLRRTRNYDEL